MHDPLCPVRTEPAVGLVDGVLCTFVRTCSTKIHVIAVRMHFPTHSRCVLDTGDPLTGTFVNSKDPDVNKINRVFATT